MDKKQMDSELALLEIETLVSNYTKTKEIINIVTQDENICPVCGASIKPEYSNWNDCYEYYNWECQQCEAKGTAVYKMIRNFEEHIDIEKGEQL